MDNTPTNQSENSESSSNSTNMKSVFIVWTIAILISLIFQYVQTLHLTYSDFLNRLEQSQIKTVEITDQKLAGVLIDPQTKQEKIFETGRVNAEVASLLAHKNITFSRAPDFSNIFAWVIPILILLFVLKSVGQKVSEAQGATGGVFGFGKSKARIYKEKEIRITFADVAGVDEAKQELQEIIEFLKCPEKFQKLGGRLPKGILLVGPPGTGKTLLAKAVAGETKRPFMFITGSEFVELFVGVGAARVRDLFEQAAQNAPCIIFIDELDALGRARGSGVLGGHDEKEQTLNQLLAELDGFDPKQGVVLLAATNRPEILDPALLRAGRFDRQILVDRPDKAGRIQIINVHLKQIVYDPSIDPAAIASMTTGFTGADLANLVNEAALLATRRSAEKVSMKDFSEAIERIVAGLEKKNRVINNQERQIIAYHEMGHALVAMALNSADQVEKVSIIPRGIGALGYTIQRPLEDRFLLSESELKTKLTILMGGRASESVNFSSISTGASDDLQKATALARHMVTQFGMSKKLGLAVYENSSNSFLQTPDDLAYTQRTYSEETAREIDCEVKQLLGDAFDMACSILKSYQKCLSEGAELLIKNETLTQDELKELVSKYLPKNGYVESMVCIPNIKQSELIASVVT
jgi:cell division protease FtsH